MYKSIRLQSSGIWHHVPVPTCQCTLLPLKLHWKQ